MSSVQEHKNNQAEKIRFNKLEAPFLKKVNNKKHINLQAMKTLKVKKINYTRNNIFVTNS